MFVNSLILLIHYIRETPTSAFANSDDPDEMQHDDACHQGLHCL